MAPKQLEGGDIDGRTDILAFGTLLHEMCTGRKAFEAKSSAGLVAAIFEHEPVPVSSVQAPAPPELDRLVKTCLAKDPDDRWQRARDLLRELKWIGEGRATADRRAERIVPASRDFRPWRSHRVVRISCTSRSATASLDCTFGSWTPSRARPYRNRGGDEPILLA